MPGSIIARKQGKNTYYYHRTGYRVKIDPTKSKKKRGSGKSKVCVTSVYLGTAEDILKRKQEKREPKSVITRNFGLIAAAFQTAREIGLPEILARNIEGTRGGTLRWIYFFVSIINRLDHATSKNKMADWLKNTILPELMGFDYAKLTSKNFWYATDDVLSESELEKQRTKEGFSDDIFAGFGEDIFTKIETELFRRIDQIMDLSPSVICYDTTNFYTYIEEPARSKLTNTCHSKDSKHHLKHVGLLMAVEQTHGIPLISRVYRANRHDSKVFSNILADLVMALRELCDESSELILILDKGNNSEENFKAMSGQISWVGALVPSHHKDLIERDLSEYHGLWNGLRYYRCRKNLMGIDCSVVLLFNSAAKRKKEHSLRRGIEKLKTKITEKWNTYKNKPNEISQGIETILKNSAYGACITASVGDGRIHFEENESEIEKRKKRFGKNLIFSNELEVETGAMIDAYREKNVIEDDFRLLKDTTIIRFRPIRHWTDTKIRAYAFCCVVSMTLMRVMQWKTERAGCRMSPSLLIEELADLKEVVLIYNLTEAKRKITARSSVQNRLWDIFKLGEVEMSLLQH